MRNQITVLVASSIMPEIIEEASVYELDGTYKFIKMILSITMIILIIVLGIVIFYIKNKKIK
ncbi:MAG: hypothetical protein J6C46_05830 [Clostridia bacterium]|nr:hypothetical protein [Clostridia bacterium]